VPACAAAAVLGAVVGVIGTIMATEVLKEGVMLFTNEVGEIVHGITNQFSGAANKNIGDAFLLVWKFFNIDTQEETY
jgi:molybdopterin/thiamine biosynthesis adenylyltransferase